MATVLLDAAPHDRPPRVTDTATLVLVLSPVRAADGTLRVLRTEVEAGGTLMASLPPRHVWERVVWNGGVVPEASYEVLCLAPGDEVWAYPRWGTGFELVPFLVAFAVGTALSVGLTALSYVLFPPQKPHVQAQDPHTFSFEGIRTAIGPGAIVPVIYGRHRVGGQLLSAFVEPTLVVRSTQLGSVIHAVAEPPTLNLLIALSEGPIDAVLTNTIQINNQPGLTWAKLQAVETRLGTPNQTPITEANETRNTHADGRPLPINVNTDEQIVYTTSGPVQAVILNLVFNQGLFNVTGKGEKEDNTVTISYRLRHTGVPTWGGWTSFDVAAQRTTPVRFGLRIDNLGMPDGAQHDIGINYGAVRHSDDLHAKSQPTLESVTEILYGQEAYPNTALLFIKAVASEALQGALPNVTVEVRGRTVRIGTFNPSEGWSDNPAWCVMDALTNTRYGDGIPDSDIDLLAFQRWADYCDQLIDGEKRHLFNYVLDQEGRVQAILMDMMGGSRSLMLKSEGQWSPRVTRDDTPVQLLSWATCTNLKITYTRDPDRVNVMEARFSNEGQDFAQDILTWPLIEDWPGEVHKASLEIRGVTKPSRIMRALQFELNRRRYENVILEFDNALDAVTLQVHDLFRFAHPLAGWGSSGRVVENSDQATIYLDQDVTMTPGVQYQLYLRSIFDQTETRVVTNTGITTNRLTVAVPYSFAPVARDTLWAFGTVSPDGAAKTFRAVEVKRKSDTTVSIRAVIHNPSVYDEPTASPLPVTTLLFNPLGPPPPLTFLVVHELVRVQPSGASMRVVNLSWEVGNLGPGYAPYGGVAIFRKTVLDASMAALITAGTIDFATAQATQASLAYTLLVNLRGHVLEFDDFSAVGGGTYDYRVVPVSGRNVPNEAGALEARIHVAGPTTPDFFPGTPLNFRLKGQPVGVTTWEGKDVHLIWDPVPQSALFSSTFYVSYFQMQVWAPDMSVHLRTVNILAYEFVYTYAMNQEDNVHAGLPGARRDLMFVLTAVTNTNRVSLDPARLTVVNPPPDMSTIEPTVIKASGYMIVKWDQYHEPRDFDHYEVHVDTMSPPVTIYNSVATSFSGMGRTIETLDITNILINVLYYVQIVPYDTFGVGVPSAISSGSAGGLTAEDFDNVPPGIPTGLVLATFTAVNPDGTIGTFVTASWDRAPEDDVRNYQVDVYVGANPAPQVYYPGRDDHAITFPVPGNTLITVALLAVDQIGNASAFGPAATITTGRDTVPPGPVANVTPVGSIRSIELFWTPPPDADYAYAQVWVATSNNRAASFFLGTGLHHFTVEGLFANDTRYFWLRSVDTSGNVGVDFTPSNPTAGVFATAGQLDTNYIANLAADKIIAGTINALVSIGVAGRVLLDGVNAFIAVIDENNVIRFKAGKLGTFAHEWGLYIADQFGRIMWQFATGATTDGIENRAVNAAKIAVGAITAEHLVTSQAVITGSAQIADAVIPHAKITDLEVEKILSGTMANFWLVGVGNRIAIDGFNGNIVVQDENATIRALLGRYGSLPQHYSLFLYDENGQLQWSPELGGVVSNGIVNGAVTTPKIPANAISGSVTFTIGSPVGGIGPTETQVGSIAFPELNTGDQVWLVATCYAAGAGAGGLGTNWAIREDNLTGPLLHAVAAASAASGNESASRIPMTVQAVYNAPTNFAPKTFVCTANGAGTINQLRFAGLRFRR